MMQGLSAIGHDRSWRPAKIPWGQRQETPARADRQFRNAPDFSLASAVLGGSRLDGQQLVALPLFEGGAEITCADESG